MTDDRNKVAGPADITLQAPHATAMRPLKGGQRILHNMNIVVFAAMGNQATPLQGCSLRLSRVESQP